MRWGNTLAIPIMPWAARPDWEPIACKGQAGERTDVRLGYDYRISEVWWRVESYCTP
jgi:hypothetical protein